MSSIVFDAGPIISLTMNNLLFIIEELKKDYAGKFYISSAVKRELVDMPIGTKKFKFEAMQVLYHIRNQTFNVLADELTKDKTMELLNIANTCFMAHNNWIRIVHYADMAGISACMHLSSEAFVIDERTTRVLIENPKKLANILRNKLHTEIEINKENLKKFLDMTGQIKIIRSSELAAVAYEKGLLDKYLPSIPKAGETLLDGVLWGLKLNGCSISRREIEQIISMERK